MAYRPLIRKGGETKAAEASDQLDGLVTSVNKKSGNVNLVLDNGIYRRWAANRSMGVYFITGYNNARIQQATGNKALSQLELGYSTGLHYFEIKIISWTGVSTTGRFGLSSVFKNGVMPDTYLTNDIFLGEVPPSGYSSFAVIRSGELKFNGTIVGNINESFVTGDVIRFCTMNGSRIWVARNNGNWNGDPSADPATNMGAIVIPQQDLYPTFNERGAPGVRQFEFVSSVDCTYPLPSSFSYYVDVPIGTNTTVPSDFFVSNSGVGNEVLVSSPSLPGTAGVWSNQPATKQLVGLPNVDNTSDLNKPVSVAQAEAIETLRYPFTKNSTFYVDFTNNNIDFFSTPVTIGSPIPGTAGLTYVSGGAAAASVGMSTHPDTFGDIYALVNDGVWGRASTAFNGLRLVYCKSVIPTGDFNDYRGLIILKNEGDVTELAFASMDDSLVTANGGDVNDYKTAVNAIGDLSSLATLSKDNIVTAINEIKDSATNTELEVFNVVWTGPSAASPVVIGAQIPSSPIGIFWAEGQYVVQVTNQAIYSVNADGTKTLVVSGTQSLTGKDTFNRIVVSPYSYVNLFQCVNGIRQLNNNLSSFSTNGLFHRQERLTDVLGILTDLTTTDKTSFVNAINEINADEIDFLQDYINARDAP